eukprot:406959-Pelagomonas_calceolata.AAC.1
MMCSLAISPAAVAAGAGGVGRGCESDLCFAEASCAHDIAPNLVPYGETCCALGLRVCALSQPNSTPVCPNPPAAPSSLQVNPRMRPECPGGHLLQAGGRMLWGVSKAARSADSIGNGLLSTYHIRNEVWAHQLQTHTYIICQGSKKFRAPGAQHMVEKNLIFNGPKYPQQPLDCPFSLC